MSHQKTALTETLKIDTLYSVHYFEYMSNFFFHGDSHNFWEVLYVDHGEAEVIADNQCLVLKKGELLFLRTSVSHSLKLKGKISPTLIVIFFECHSSSMNFFHNQIFSIANRENVLMANIISETRELFSSPVEVPYLSEVSPKQNVQNDTVQMIKVNLELLLLHMLQRLKSNLSCPSLTHSFRQTNSDMLYNRILKCLESHLTERLTIDQICRETLIGRSQLQKLFHKKTNCGIIDYFAHMKIVAAKQLIRDSRLNFTQISDYLGYSSVQYFSRQFKKVAGMTPSEYSSSVKLLSSNIRSLSSDKQPFLL